MTKITPEQLDELEEEMNKLMTEPSPERFTFNFYSDWDSFIFWQPMNWRNFTFIHLDLESNGYSSILEISFAILGLHFNFNWWRKQLKIPQ